MFKEIKNKIESKGISTNLFGRFLVNTKDALSKIKNKASHAKNTIFYKGSSTLYIAMLMDKYKSAYIPIPKAASSSLRHFFFESIYGRKPTYDTDSLIEAFPTVPLASLNKIYPRYFKFTFVRNPYDRVLSCYLNRVKKSLIPGFHKFRIFRNDMSFNEFVKAICKISDKESDRHFVSQSYVLTDKKGSLIPDFIGKFENLEEDFRKICNKIGINNPEKLLHKNKSERNNNYIEYYDEETKRMVYERYKKDFDIFAYNK